MPLNYEMVSNIISTEHREVRQMYLNNGKHSWTFRCENGEEESMIDYLAHAANDSRNPLEREDAEIVAKGFRENLSEF
jgi:hypothetical protein